MARSPSTLRAAPIALLGALSAMSPTRADAAPGPSDRLHVLEIISEFDQVPAARVLASLLILRFGADGRFTVSNETPALADHARFVKACDLKGFEPRVLREDADRRLDGRCLRGIASRLGTSRLVVSFVYSASDGRRWIKARLWQGDGAEVSKALPFETEPEARERLAERLYRHLSRPERAADVRLTAPAQASGGELWVDGKALGAFAPGLELTVEAGEHSFEVRREGKAVAEAKATAKAGTTTELSLAAVFVPNARIPIEFPDPPPQVVPPPAGGGWKRPAGFVGLGLGAALLGAGVVSSLRTRSIYDDLDSELPLVRYRSDVSGDACDQASAGVVSSQNGAATPGRVDRLCSGASRFQVAQYVFYVTGALAAGAGAYLVLTAPKADGVPSARSGPGAALAPAWSVRPWGGPNAGGAQFRVTFLLSRRLGDARKERLAGRHDDRGRGRGGGALVRVRPLLWRRHRRSDV